MSTDEHHEFSPSSFPMWDKCVHFETDQEGMDGENHPAHRGSLQHTGLEMIMTSEYAQFESVSLEGQKWITDNLKPDEIANIDFASNRIAKILGENGIAIDEIRVEEKLVVFASDFTTTYGTGDVVGTGKNFVIVIDYKGGNEREYDPQLKTYALGAMQETGTNKALLVVVYGRGKMDTQTWFELDECQTFFDDMMYKLQHKDEYECISNKYCSWCKKADTCKARQKDILSSRKMLSPKDKNVLGGITYRTDLTKLNPDKFGKLLSFAKLVEAWAKDVKAIAGKKLNKEPESVTGFYMKEGSCRVSIDAKKAYEIAVDKKEIYPEDFVKCSSVAKGKFMDLLYGDKSGLKASKEDFQEVFKDAILTGSKSKSSLTEGVDKSKEIV